MSARPTLPLGLVYDLPIDEYHASAGISNSGLSDFARSPRHFHALHINPDRPPEPERAGQLEGNLAHCLILEPDKFSQRYHVGPVDDKRLAAWKHWADKPRPSGVELVKPSQHEVAKAQALSVRSIPDVAALLSVGRAEVSAFWIDPETGELCRCRPDWVHPVNDDAVILLDLKTCSDASPDEFGRQIARKNYHRQAALYSDGYEIASGKRVLGFVFVAVESAWPFAASALMLDDEGIAKGRAEIAELLPRYAECRASDSWPGYADAIGIVSMPAWALAA